uniref:Protein kinase domain-containing protein n=1 Tax=Globisporangium ultimum (strain ATCC 200006 / CBS 805.95 / DAOM BR144) TaxID=431595 RepID=K3X2A5_GLOUD
MDAGSLPDSLFTASTDSLLMDSLVGDMTFETALTVQKRSARAYWGQITLLLGYGGMFLLCTILLVYMRVNRYGAFRGDARAARKIILPAFEPLLWILAATTGSYVAFFSTTLATHFYKVYPPMYQLEMFYAGRQFVFVIVIVFMLQKSVSWPALRRSVAISFILASYTIPIVWVLTTYYDPAGATVFWTQVSSRFALLFLFLYVFLWPPGRANRVPMRQFCVFVFIYHGISILSLSLGRLQFQKASGILGHMCLVWGSLCPLLIWRILKADTEFWRGVGHRACSFHNMMAQQTQLDERVFSSHGIHLLIEMHRKYVIDFAHLEIKRKIGVGTNAVVFNGSLNFTTEVAIKVYTPRHFTEETVAAFSHEAALSATLNHPNVVKFYGMCICPPTVCLVSELCLGNLEDIMTAIARREQSPQRQQMLINISYMIDAARALAYIHSFSPPFLHRDVKPANFLIDTENNVKLTDFGESRSIPRHKVTEQATPIRGSTGSTRGAAFTVGMVKMTVTGTVDYMPPEMIAGRCGIATYGEAADVYSLAITFWDILNPGQDRYPNLHNHMLIFETVIGGFRPDLDISMHPRLRELIANAWQTDPSMRPSAQRIVDTLEIIQEELLASFASELSEDLERTELADASPLAYQEKFFTGQYALEKMEEFEYVEAASEGIRLGNGLMDTGFLHHFHHAQSFEKSDEMYFFDENNVKFCQQFAIMEADLTEDSEGSGDSGEFHLADSLALSLKQTSSRQHVFSQLTSSFLSSSRSQNKASSLDGPANAPSEPPSLTNCQCRQLGQRLDSTHRRAHRRHSRRQGKQPQQHRSQSKRRSERKQPLANPFRRKCPPIVEEDNALDRKLLTDDDRASSARRHHRRRSCDDDDDSDDDDDDDELDEYDVNDLDDDRYRPIAVTITA